MPGLKLPFLRRHRVEWVEIVEPRSRERMFVNVVTGECGWDEPAGVTIKRLHEQDGQQWWELFDVKTSRFYYYNATTQQTCWQKPKNNSSIIIPLAKFQLLKQNSSSPSNSSGDVAKERKEVATQTRDTACVLVNNSTQTTPPPSLRRSMVHYYSPSASGEQQKDTWSAKRSLRSYLINEARHARGLTGLPQDEVSDFDDDLWESDDDCEDASSTSDQWDADDEIDHNEDNDEDEDDDEDEELECDRRLAHISLNNKTDTEYETENDELESGHRESEKDSADNQSFGSTYVDNSFVFVGPEVSQSSSWHTYTPHATTTDSTHYNLTKSEVHRHSSASPNAFQTEKASARAGMSESPPPVPGDLLRRPVEHRKQSAPQPPPHQPPVPPQRGLSLASYEISVPSPPPKVAPVTAGHSTLPPALSSLDRIAGLRAPLAPGVKSATSTGSKEKKDEKKSKEKRGSSRASSDLEKLSSNGVGKNGSASDQQIMEKFARENLNRHIKRGVGNQLLKRKTSLKAMLTWSKNSIKQPMIATLIGGNVSGGNRSEIKSEAITCFKLIQQYMGDRLVPDRKDFVQSNKESIAFDLITRACQRHELRDEIYVQLCRQTTDNPRKSSLAAGFELMACCLCYFPPSIKFSPYLASFLTNSPLRDAPVTCPEDDEALSLMNHCYKLLVKVRGVHMAEGSGHCGSGTIYCRKPVTPKELEMVGDAIDRRFVGIFGESVESLMELQRKRWPEKRLPWILTTLCEAITKMGGASIEGIFRIAADTDELSFIKLVIDCINFDLLDDDGDILELLNHNSDEPVDVHVFACLLKQWFRSLKEPIVPSELYEMCLEKAGNAHEATSIIMNQLPKANKVILAYLISFLQVFSAPENSNATKMDDSNLSMIWAPNLLRSNQPNPLSSHPSVIFENTRKEMTFIRTLIQSLDTSFVQGIR